MIEYKIEKASAIVDEIKPLLHQQYEETEKHITGLELDPDYDRYVKLDELGYLKCITCRLDNKLIGYAIFFIHQHIHHKTCLTASEDLYYIAPEHRAGRVAYKLFKESERLLKEQHIQRIIMSCKTYIDQTKLFEHLGFTLYEKHFTKMI